VHRPAYYWRGYNFTDYWFGLYKVSATPGAAIKWYDGNPSTYRNWTRGEPNEVTTCVCYAKDGFKDRDCSREYYYTCKKRAGSNLFLLAKENS